MMRESSIYVPGHKPYVLVVLTRGTKEQKRSNTLIADISRAIYQEIIYQEIIAEKAHRSQ